MTDTSSMGEIPDDILKAANECVRDMCVDPLKPMTPFIARAILAERKRCAAVAFDFNDGKHIALDAREGRFPKKSQVKDAIGRTILAGVSP